MKKQHLFLIMLFGISVSTAACKKCQTCSFQTVEEDVCRDDFNSPQVYDAYILSLESAGYECN